MPTTPRKDTAAKAEATGSDLTFTYKDVEFTTPPTSEWTVDALEHFEDGLITKGLRDVLAPAEYAKFKAMNPKTDDLADFFGALSTAVGVQGN